MLKSLNQKLDEKSAILFLSLQKIYNANITNDLIEIRSWINGGSPRNPQTHFQMNSKEKRLRKIKKLWVPLEYEEIFSFIFPSSLSSHLHWIKNEEERMGTPFCWEDISHGSFFAINNWEQSFCAFRHVGFFYIYIL